MCALLNVYDFICDMLVYILIHHCTNCRIVKIEVCSCIINGSSLKQPMTDCSADFLEDVIESLAVLQRHSLWLNPSVVLSPAASSRWTLCVWM